MDKAPSVLPTVFADEALLRATTLPHILGGCGAHLRAPAAKARHPAALGACARPVARIDEFLSHTWLDPGWRKALCLCFYYNGVQAAVASAAAAAAACALTLAGALPPWVDEEWAHGGETLTAGVSHWSSLAGVATFALVVASWHHAPACLGGGRGGRLFFDKLCIDQGDPERQRAGIQSLGAFIAHSDRFLLLWSPRYFSRLWCTFEVATLLHLRGPRAVRGEGSPAQRRPAGTALDYRPLHLSSLKLGVLASLQCWFLLTQAAAAGAGVTGAPTALQAFLVGVWPALLFAAGLMHALKGYASDREALEAQLATFAIESTACTLDSDRSDIYSTVEHWFASLEHFNLLVRTDMSRDIMELVSASSFPLDLIGYSVLPCLFNALDYTAAYAQFRDKEFQLTCTIAVFLVALVPVIFMLCAALVANSRFALARGGTATENRFYTFVESLPSLLVSSACHVGNVTLVLPRGPLAELAYGAAMLALIAALWGYLGRWQRKETMRHSEVCERRRSESINSVEQALSI